MFAPSPNDTQRSCKTIECAFIFTGTIRNRLIEQDWSIEYQGGTVLLIRWENVCCFAGGHALWFKCIIGEHKRILLRLEIYWIMARGTKSSGCVGTRMKRNERKKKSGRVGYFSRWKQTRYVYGNFNRCCFGLSTGWTFPIRLDGDSWQQKSANVFRSNFR